MYLVEEARSRFKRANQRGLESLDDRVFVPHRLRGLRKPGQLPPPEAGSEWEGVGVKSSAAATPADDKPEPDDAHV